MTVEELLGKEPIQAIKVLLSNEFGAPSTPDWFVITRISTIGTKSMRVYAVFNELYVPLEYRHGVTEAFSVNIDKISLSMLNANGPIRLTTSSIYNNKTYAQLLSERYPRLLISPDDLEEEYPELGDTVLTSRLHSARWYGTCEIKLEHVVEDINKFIKRTSLVIDHDSGLNIHQVHDRLLSALARTNITELPIAISNNSATMVDGSLEQIGHDTDRYNSQVSFEFIYPYSGKLTVRYNRRHFAGTYGVPVHMRVTEIPTIEQILAQVNSTLGSDILMEELEPFEVPTEVVNGELRVLDGKYHLGIVDTSLAHLGGVWIYLERSYGN